VGVLIEVPVMLSVVKVVNASKPWYERGRAVRRVAAQTTAHRLDTSPQKEV